MGAGGKKKEPQLSAEEKAAAKAEKAREKAQSDLLKAVKNNDVKKATVAVEKGADVQAMLDEKNNTHMHIAASFGAFRIIDYLHRLGCPVDVKNEVCMPKASA